MYPAMVLIFWAGILLAVQAFFRRANRWVTWSVFAVVPWFLVGHWGRANDVGLFPWVKLASLLFAATWLTALRFTSLGQSRWALAVAFLLLPINILEAVTKDMVGGHAAHHLVAFSGVMLLFGLPNPVSSIQIDSSRSLRDLHYLGLSRLWIIGYTIWNAAFVYLNFPAITGHQLAVLSAALIVGLIEPRLWLQARTFSLAFDLLLLPTFPTILIPLTDTAHWNSPTRENLVATVCLGVMIACVVRFVQRRRQTPDKQFSNATLARESS